MQKYVEYAKQLRHELHQIPEIGFDLPKTLAVVRRELDAMGVSYTDEFGQSSIVVTINEGKPFTIGLRADMDALPIQENSSNPFPSQHPGQMHACGHDAHTAQMLAVTKKLNDIKDSINCRIKILFTPAEEYITPGCSVLAKNGVMDDIDCALACHMDPTIPVGKVGLLSGGMNANSSGVIVEFFGKAAHAHSPHNGIDAIRMGVEAYTAMQMIVSREVAAQEPCILNVGAFNAGHTNNIICDYAKLFLTIRTWSDELSKKMERRVREICEGIATICGGSAKITTTKFLPYVYNDPSLIETLKKTAYKTLNEENVVTPIRSLGGEDFAFFSRIKPCVLFRLGTRNNTNPDTQVALHNDHFDIDEDCFATGISLFVSFVLDNQNGIAF